MVYWMPPGVMCNSDCLRPAQGLRSALHHALLLADNALPIKYATHSCQADFGLALTALAGMHIMSCIKQSARSHKASLTSA